MLRAPQLVQSPASGCASPVLFGMTAPRLGSRSRAPAPMAEPHAADAQRWTPAVPASLRCGACDWGALPESAFWCFSELPHFLYIF